MLGGAAAVLSVAITGDTKGLEQALGDASGAVAKTNKGFAGGVGGMLAFAGGATAVAAGIGAVTMAAADDAAEQARLEAAIKASGAATGDWQAAMDEAVKSGQALAFSDTETRNALVPLIGATGDMTEAQALLATAQDVARLTGMDLEQASRALIKVNEGQVDALTRYGIVVDEGSTSTEALAQIQAQAAGQAQTFADSSAGSMAKLQDAFGEIAETIGAAFLPALDAILPAIGPLLEAVGELITALLPVFIPLLKLAADILVTLARVITNVVRALKPLIDMLAKGIEAVGDFVGQIGGLVNFGGNANTRAAGTTFVTVHTGADPDSVVKAIRKYASVNGGRAGQLRAWS